MRNSAGNYGSILETGNFRTVGKHRALFQFWRENLDVENSEKDTVNKWIKTMTDEVLDKSFEDQKVLTQDWLLVRLLNFAQRAHYRNQKNISWILAVFEYGKYVIVPF